MTIRELRDQIKTLPDNLEVFIRCVNNSRGNIIETGKFERSTYKDPAYRGNRDCVIIEPENVLIDK